MLYIFAEITYSATLYIDKIDKLLRIQNYLNKFEQNKEKYVNCIGSVPKRTFV